MIRKKEYLWLTLGTIVFLGLSFLLFMITQTHCDIDSKAYLERMHNIGTTLPYFGLGYVFFLKMVYGTFSSITAIIWIQVLLALCSGYLLFYTARRFFGRREALVAFMFYSVNVGFITFAQFILTEIILVSLLVLFVFFFLLFLQTALPKHLVFAGFTLGLSIIVKPAAFLYLVFLLPFFVVMRAKVPLFVFIIAFSMPVLGYMSYNKVTFNSFSIGSLASVNLYFWWFPNVLAHLHGTSADDERVLLQEINGPCTSFKRVDYYFKTMFIRHPFVFGYVWFKNIMKTMFGLFTTNLRLLVDASIKGGDVSFFKNKGNILERMISYLHGGSAHSWLFVVAVYEMLWNLMRFICVFIGLYVLFVRGYYNILYFFSSYITHFAIITGHDGCARFRMMFEFVLILLAAYGFVAFYDWLRKIRHV